MNYNILRLNTINNLNKSNKKLLLVLVLTIAVPLTVFLTIKGIEYLTKGAATTVNVSFSQPSLTLNPDATSPTTINILTNASTSEVGFVRVEFTFDPAKIMLASEITPTSLFKKVIKTTTATEANTTGRVTMVLGLDPADRTSPPTSSFQVATVSLKAKPGTSGTSSLTFDNSKMQIVDMTAVANTITSTNTSISITSATTPPTSVLMNFSFMMQGITAPATKTIDVTLKNAGTTTVAATNSITATANATGRFIGTIDNNIPAGQYDVYIKSQSYLQRKFANVTLATGTNNKDFTANPLRAGDFTGNNVINIQDISEILSKYTVLTQPVDTTTSKYDINNSTTLTILDISLVLSNYTALTVPGE